MIPTPGKLYRVKVEFWNNIEKKNIIPYGSHNFHSGDIVMLTELRRILPEDPSVVIPDHLRNTDLLFVVFLAGKKNVEMAFYDTADTFDELIEEVIV